MGLVAVEDTFECGWCPKQSKGSRVYLTDPTVFPEGWHVVTSAGDIWGTRPSKRFKFCFCLDSMELMCNECFQIQSKQFRKEKLDPFQSVSTSPIKKPYRINSSLYGVFTLENKEGS